MKLAKKKHELIVKGQCCKIICDATYTGEVERRISERIMDHSGCDDKSHLYEHAEKSVKVNVDIDHVWNSVEWI